MGINIRPNNRCAHACHATLIDAACLIARRDFRADNELLAALGTASESAAGLLTRVNR